MTVSYWKKNQRAEKKTMDTEEKTQLAPAQKPWSRKPPQPSGTSAIGRICEGGLVPTPYNNKINNRPMLKKKQPIKNSLEPREQRDASSVDEEQKKTEHLAPAQKPAPEFLWRGGWLRIRPHVWSTPWRWGLPHQQHKNKEANSGRHWGLGVIRRPVIQKLHVNQQKKLQGNSYL